MRLVRHPYAVPAAWSTALAVLLLGPALAPGYVLTYDMVWVPQLALRPDMLGIGAALPRAVPSDAVVAVLDDLVPAMLLQKVVLVGVLVAGGVGAAALIRDRPVFAQLAAVTLYVWNPFVAERLGIGHWPLLVAYAVLPWVAVAVRDRGGAARLGPLLVMGSLSASAGIITLLMLVSLEVRRGLTQRRLFTLLALAIGANAPWLVAGLLHAPAATSSAAAARVFALNDEGHLPGPLAAFGLGGIWNTQVMPASRTSPVAVLGLAVLLMLAAAGLRRWWRTPGDRGLGLAWLLGWGWACLTWLLPSVSGWLADTIPGGGVLRDGSRTLALCAPFLAVLVADGVVALAARVAEPAVRAVLGGLLALVPMAFLPDIGWGLGGTLGAVDYPESYVGARAAVRGPGDVLLLPASSYRAPAWNASRPVLDPTGRYLRLDYTASDVLVVDGHPLPGEDPRARAAFAVLAGPRPAADLSQLGFGYVVTDAAPTGRTVDATVVYRSADVTVQRLSGVRLRRAPVGWVVAMTLAWVGFVAAGSAGLLQSVVRAVRARAARRRRTGKPSTSR